MANHGRNVSNSRSMSFGAHQLVSEPADPWSHGCPQSSPYFSPQPSWPYLTPPPPPPQPLDPVFESSKEGSPGHGESGGVTAEGRRVPDRILSIEDTMGALSGTILNLSGRFDVFEDKFDKLERVMEELARSKKNHEGLNQQSFSTPIPHYTMAAQSHFPSMQMSNSPVHASMTHPWSVNSSVMNPVLAANDQTPVGSLISQQNPMGSMTSGHECMHKESETRIQILTAIAQKYKGDSKSSEEQLQILTAAAQKYKARKDSKAIEEQPQLYSPSPPKYHTALYVLDEVCEENLLMDKEKKEEESKEPTAEEFPDSSFPEVSILYLDASLPVEDQDNLYLEEDDPLVEATSEFSVTLNSSVCGKGSKSDGILVSGTVSVEASSVTIISKSGTSPTGSVDTVKHEVGNRSSDIDATVQKVVSHDVASFELSLTDLLSLQEVIMGVGSLALFAGGMVWDPGDKENVTVDVTNPKWDILACDKKFKASEIKNSEFHLLNGTPVQVSFMTSEEKQFISPYDDFSVLRFPWEQGENERQFSMYIFLPDAREGLWCLLEKLSSEPGFLDHHQPRQKALVENFKMAFTAGCDLSEMVDSLVGGSLLVSSIYHKSVIVTNEEGTEAVGIWESFKVKVWDPGIKIIHSLTLGQGHFEGVGIDKYLANLGSKWGITGLLPRLCTAGLFSNSASPHHHGHVSSPPHCQVTQFG